MVSALVFIGTALTSPEYKCWIENTANGTKLSNEVTVIGKIDNTPPYITNVQFPSGYTRDTHSTAIQFTIKDDDSGLDGSIKQGVDSLGHPVIGSTYGMCEYKWEIDRVIPGVFHPKQSVIISPANGAKSFVVTKNWDDIFYLEATRLKLQVQLTDMAGNRTTQTIYSEPTLLDETKYHREDSYLYYSLDNYDGDSSLGYNYYLGSKHGRCCCWSQ